MIDAFSVFQFFLSLVTTGLGRSSSYAPRKASALDLLPPSHLVLTNDVYVVEGEPLMFNLRGRMTGNGLVVFLSFFFELLPSDLVAYKNLRI
jgi:hypothetical protein